MTRMVSTRQRMLVSRDWMTDSRGRMVNARGRIYRVVSTGAILAVLFAVTLSTGCTRELIIRQDPLINTGMNRYDEQFLGEPLEVTVVCVYPNDFKDNDVNYWLLPDAELTSETFYEKRRSREIKLPPDQILVFTNDRDVYGKKVGKRLQGARIEGRAERSVKIAFKGPASHKNSVIYVFPKFIGPDGKVLQVAPAKFHPPGKYPSTLRVHIGFDRGSDENYGQYIEIEKGGK